MKYKDIGAITNSRAVENIAREVTASLFSSIEPSSPNPATNKRTPDNRIPIPPNIFPDRPFTEVMSPSERE